MSSIELDVRNMSCGTCVNHVTQALKQVAGVRGVQVDLPGGRVRVQVDDAVASNPAATPPLTTALVTALDAAGYPAAPATSSATAAAGEAAPTRAASSGSGSAPAQGQGRAGSKGCCCGR